MEHILFYSLGVVTVTSLALVVGMVRLQKQFLDLQRSIQFLQKQMENTERYSDDRHRDMQNICRDLDRRIDDESQALYRTIDSRLDKLENKFNTKK